MSLIQIDHLCTIHGTNGTKGGGKIIRSVVYSTICPSILKNYTWTGNSSNNNKTIQKRDFNKKANIFAIFFSVIYAYDKNYTKSQCEDDFKNRIFKYVKTAAEKM